MGKISVIIPVYNAGPYLEKCIASVMGQTYADLEIVCIDSGSADQSLSIMKRCMEQDGRIRLLQVPLEGVSESRNKGIAASAGDYIMFVDADDWIEHTACEIALKKAQETNADIVMWPYIREFGDTSLPKKIFSEEEIVFEETEVKTKLHRRAIGLVGDELSCPENADSLCPAWGKLYKAGLIKDNGIQFPDIREIGTYEDGIFNLYALQYAKRVVYIQQYLYHYRKNNSDSLTTKYKPELFAQWQNLFRLMEGYINENRLPQAYHEALENRICLSVLGQGLNMLEAPVSGNEKKGMIKSMLRDPGYSKAFEHLQMQYFPMHWKLFFNAAKRRQAGLLFFLLTNIKKRIGTA